jgi:hypothetical protein
MNFLDLTFKEKIEQVALAILAALGIIFDVATTEYIVFVFICILYTHDKFAQSRMQMETLTEEIAALKEQMMIDRL